MDKPLKPPLRKPHFWENPGYVLYHWWAEIYTSWQERFNPKWREPLPPIPCQFCGQTDHKEAYCPNLVKMGFLPGQDETDGPEVVNKAPN
jgi:hypothetical protein